MASKLVERARTDSAIDSDEDPSAYSFDEVCSFDDVALREIRKLVGMSRMALEEAASYFADMTDPVKRAAAEQLLESA